uniref:Uncharacterized protein n=2 Tax=Anguilla anguilla TaxID=7936 RepID=A0A0E9UZS5_ANGAN
MEADVLLFAQVILMPGHALKGLNYSLVRMINLLFNDLIIIDLAQITLSLYLMVLVAV